MSHGGGGGVFGDDPALATYQKQQLAKQVKEQRREIVALERRLAQQQQQHERLDAAVLHVTSLWAQLNDDVRTISRRAGEPVEGTNDVGALTRRLLKASGDAAVASASEAAVNGAAAGVAGDELSEEVRGQAAAQAQATHGCLVAVLDAIDATRSRHAELADRLAAGVGEGDAAAALTAEHTRLSAEIEAARKAADEAAAERRAAAAEAGALRKANDAHETKATALAQQLDVALADIDQLKRSIAKLDAGRDVPPQLTPGAKEMKAAVGAHLKGVKEEEGGAAGGGAQGGSGAGGAKAEPGSAADRERREALAARAELEDRLKQKEVEAKTVFDTQMALLQEVRQLQDVLGDEGHVLQTRPYQALHQQVSELHAEVERYRDGVARLQQERTELVASERDALSRAEAGDHARMLHRQAEVRIGELEARIKTVATERDRASFQLEQEREQAGRRKTNDELRSLIATLQKEAKLLKEEAAKHKALKDAAEGADKSAREAAAALEVERAQVAELTRQKEERDAAAAKHADALKELEHEKEDLRLFVEVLQETGEAAPADAATAEAARRNAEAEAAELRQRVEEAALTKEKAAAEARAQEASRRAEALEVSAAALRAKLAASKKEVEAQAADLEARNLDTEALVQEIQNVGSAYEDMQAQNGRLLAQLAENDEYAAKVVAERIQVTQGQKRLQEELEAAERRVAHLQGASDASTKRVAVLEEQLRGAKAEVAKAQEDVLQVNLSLEASRLALKDLDALNGALQASQQQAAELSQRSSKELEELEQERAKRRKLEEDVSALKAKCNNLLRTGAGGVADKQLEQELQAYKKLFICSVCNTRRREQIITKCYHLFCKDCIKANLETRHRKCPACGLAFSSSDVHTVFF